MSEIIQFPRNSQDLDCRTNVLMRLIRFAKEKELVYAVPFVNVPYFCYEIYRLRVKGQQFKQNLMEFIESLNPEERTHYTRAVECLESMAPIQFDRFLADHLSSVKLSQTPREALDTFLELAEQHEKKSYLSRV